MFEDQLSPDELAHLIRLLGDLWRGVPRLRRWWAARKNTPAALTFDDLAEIHRGLSPLRVERFPGGHSRQRELLTGIQASAYLRERGWVGRTVDLPDATLIDTSSLGRWSSMALVYISKPDPADTHERIALRFQCFSRRTRAYDFLKAAPWKGEIRVRGEIVKAGSLGGDPITLTRCEFDPPAPRDGA